MNSARLESVKKWKRRIQDELDNVVAFWLHSSHDDDNGGFFTCMDADGQVFDDTKYTWLQARQVWCYARLHNEVSRFEEENLLEPALKGADFLLKNCLIKRDGYTRCCFSMTVDGKPTKIQRNLFSECFFVMAMSEVWRTTKKDKYKLAAVEMMKQIKRWCMVDDAQLEREVLPGNQPTSSLAVPMMALCLCRQLYECNLIWCDDANDLVNWSVKELLLHVQREGAIILENVSRDGKELDGSAGRLHIPGHAIECGWFILDHAMAIGDNSLAKKAIEHFIEEPFKLGWDDDNGGLLYFLDADTLPAVQLEWDMKLWWPHNEAMIAFLMAFFHSKEIKHFEMFEKTAEYAFEKFRDEIHGGWYGYLNKQGVLSNRLKGGPWKGFFHVPRCLYLCEKLLDDILEKELGNQK